MSESHDRQAVLERGAEEGRESQERAHRNLAHISLLISDSQLREEAEDRSPNGAQAVRRMSCRTAYIGGTIFKGSHALQIRGATNWGSWVRRNPEQIQEYSTGND